MSNESLASRELTPTERRFIGFVTSHTPHRVADATFKGDYALLEGGYQIKVDGGILVPDRIRFDKQDHTDWIDDDDESLPPDLQTETYYGASVWINRTAYITRCSETNGWDQGVIDNVPTGDVTVINEYVEAMLDCLEQMEAANQLVLISPEG